MESNWLTNIFNGNSLIAWIATIALSGGIGALLMKFGKIVKRAAYTTEDVAQLVLLLYSITEDGKVTAQEIEAIRAKLQEVLNDIQSKFPQEYKLAVKKFATQNKNSSQYAAKLARTIDEE